METDNEPGNCVADILRDLQPRGEGRQNGNEKNNDDYMIMVSVQKKDREIQTGNLRS